MARLFHGDERFLVDERSRALLDEWRTELVSDFGLETMEGAGLAPARLQDAVLQGPFLDPYRVVFARMETTSKRCLPCGRALTRRKSVCVSMAPTACARLPMAGFW